MLAKEKRLKLEKYKKLSSFRFGLLQDLLTLYEQLQKENISFRDVKVFVLSRVKIEEKKETKAKKYQLKWKKRAPKCPNCSESLRLRRISIPKGPQNLFGWESSWYCNSSDCAYELYSEKTSEAELAKYKLL